ncbi:MAG: hypothetical protein GC129_00810 [Proteobacteria bacterium]|nr:hypothetical protein [Pseudomonadota bacterium]
MTTPLNAKITEAAAQALAVHGLTLVQAMLTGSGGRLTLQVLAEQADGTGATLEQCTQASRTLSAQLDVADIITSRYVLEVGSPGLDRPLTSLADYQRFLGKGVHIRFTRPVYVESVAKELGAITGILQKVEGEALTVALEGGPKTASFTYKQVHHAHLAPTAQEVEDYVRTASTRSKNQNPDLPNN